MMTIGRPAATTTSAHAQEVGQAPRSLSILILGGTDFVGPALVEYAQRRGHSLTLFNRGRTNPKLFPNVEKLRGDRAGDLDALKGRSWDAVIDTHPWRPSWVRATAELLADAVEQYVFISTISVYADTSTIGLDEQSPVATMENPESEDIAGGQNYGALKAICEQTVEAIMPGRATNIRPGLIVGPRDNGPRFAYWPVRIEQGGEVLAPGNHDDPVQYVDVRDLARFIINAVEQRHMGTYNVTGPTTPTNIAELLYGCKAVTTDEATFTWVDADFLAEQNVRPWVDMPVWIPPRGDHIGFHRISIQKAIDAGLTTRKLADTVVATLKWYHAEVASNQPVPMAGISRERERELLEKWKAARSTEPVD